MLLAQTGAVGICPSCRGEGQIGETCGERICMQRSYAFIPAQDYDLDDAVDPLIGRYLGDWLVTRTLGTGGFGRVYKAMQVRIGLHAAIKVLKTDLSASAHHDVRQSKFEQEAQALARLSHPNIVTLHGAGTFRGVPWIAMELVENARTLWDEMVARGTAPALPPLPPLLVNERRETEVQGSRELAGLVVPPKGESIEVEVVAAATDEAPADLPTVMAPRASERATRPFSVSEVESVLLQVLAALEAAHCDGIVHRDVKPENIMLREVPGHGTFVKVLDFGLAKLTEDRTETSVLVGTPAYMAPEQLKRAPLGPWTDRYSLVVIAFELLTGQLAYPGPSISDVIGQKLDPQYDPWSRVAHTGLPAAVHTLFTRGLASDPTQRFQSAEELRRAIIDATCALREQNGEELAVDGLFQNNDTRATHLSPEASQVVPFERPKARRRKQLVLGVAGVAALLLIALMLSGSSSPQTQLSAAAPRELPPAAPPPARPAAVPSAHPQPPAPAPSDPVAALEDGQVTPITRVSEGDELPESVRIPSGRLLREVGSDRQEVILEHDIAMMPTEVTTEAWQALMGTRPTRFAGAEACPSCPVDSVSWYDAVAYANKLSHSQWLAECYDLEGCRGEPGSGDYACSVVRFAGIDCEGWRLPTEAEWELAARTGVRGPLTLDIGTQSWTRYDARGRTHPVATKAANAWGIYDIVGNVREWCHDGFAAYGKSRVVDPTGAAWANEKVVRGGSWYSVPATYDPATRESLSPKTAAGDVGFRLVRTLSAR